MQIGQGFNPHSLFVSSPLPEWLERRPELSPGAKLVYARLARFGGRDGSAYPSRETLAEAVGLPLRTVARHLAELKEARLVVADRPGLGRSNRYRFLWHEWIEETRSEAPDVPDRPVREANMAHQTGQNGPSEVPDRPILVRESVEENQKKKDMVHRGADAPVSEKEPTEGTPKRWPANRPPPPPAPSTRSTPKKKASRHEYDPRFLEAWSELPARSGSDPKWDAFKAWRARVEKDKVDPVELLEGAKRYAIYCDLAGKTDTELVMQGVTFFGPNEHFRNPWEAPPPNGNGRHRSR